MLLFGANAPCQTQGEGAAAWLESQEGKKWGNLVESSLPLEHCITHSTRGAGESPWPVKGKLLHSGCF